MLIRRLLLLFLILMEPLAAHAEAAFWTALYSFISTYWVEIAAIAVSVVESSLQRQAARAAEARRRDEYNDNLRDRTAMLLEDAPPWRIVHGRAVVGGFIVAEFTSDAQGTDDKGNTYVKPDGYRHIVYALAAHECEAIHEIFIDGKAVGPRDALGFPTAGPFYGVDNLINQNQIPSNGILSVPAGITSVLVCQLVTPPDHDGYQDPPVDQPFTLNASKTTLTSTPFAFVTYTVEGANASVRVSTHLGAPDQAVDSYLNGVKPQQWDATHVLSGWAYLTVTLRLENTEFQGGPPQITADVSGRRIYDVRRQIMVNPVVGGAVAGVPGTAPTDYDFPSTLAGLTRNVVAVGEEYGVPYVDVNYSGITSTAIDMYLNFGTAYPAAAAGQHAFSGVFLRPIVGTFAQFQIAELQLQERTGNTVNATTTLNLKPLPFLSASLRDNRLKLDRVFSNGGTTGVNQAIRLNMVQGANINITLRIGLPTLSIGSDAIAWSDNPALCTADFLTAEWGYQVTTAEINVPSLIVAANDCDETTTFTYVDVNGNPVSHFTGPQYTMNGAFTTADSKEAVLEDMKTSMAGYAIPSGQWFISAGVWHPPVMTLGDDNRMGPTTIVQSDTGIADLINGTRGNYFPAPIYGDGTAYVLNGDHVAGSTTVKVISGTGDIPTGVGVMFDTDDTLYVVLAGDYGGGQLLLPYPGTSKFLPSGTTVQLIAQGGQTPSDFTPYQNDSYVVADGEPLWGSTTFPYTNDGARCLNLARIKVEQSRNGLVVNYPAKMVGWPLRPGDRIVLNDADFKFEDDTFRVTDWNFSITGAVNLTLQKDVPETYDQIDAAIELSVPTSRWQDPTSVNPVDNLQAFSGTDQLLQYPDGSIVTRVLVTWDRITSPFVAGGQGYIEVSWFTPFDDTPYKMQVSGDDVGAYIEGVIDEMKLVIGVTVVNSLPKRSQTIYIAHTVIGKTAPPGPVAGLTATAITGAIRLSWTPGTEVDEDGVEFGIAGTDWASSHGLEGQTAKSFAAGAGVAVYDWLWPSPGSYNIRARRRDTTGNESTEVILGITVTASSISIDFTSLANRPLDTTNMVTTPVFDGGAIRTWSTGTVVAVAGQSWGKAISVSIRDCLQTGAPIPVRGGERLWVQADISSALTTLLSTFGFMAYNAAGTSLGLCSLPFFNAATGWTHKEGFVQVPATAVSIVPDIFTNASSGFGTLLAANLYIGRAAPGATTGTTDASFVNSSNVMLNGNQARKTVNNGVWDAQVYTMDGFIGGAFAQVTVSALNSFVMFGLNTDPITDASYVSIDFTWYLAGNVAAIYESGVQVASGISFNLGDVFDVIYQGQFINYIQNGVVIRTRPAPPGVKYFFDSSLYDGNSVLTNIRFGPYQNTFLSRAGNLIDTSWWAPGVVPTSRWQTNQGGGSDVFVVAGLPDGSTGICWQATSDTQAAAGGGWNPNTDATNSFTIDPNKTYLFVCYTKGVGAVDAVEYFGVTPGIVCDLNTSTPTANPYFSSGVPHDPVDWHLHIGWVYPAGTTGHSLAKSGSYSCGTGQQLNQGLNFNWAAGSTVASTRAYQYYATAGQSAKQLFAWPAVYVADGSEPSIDDLLSMIVPTQRIALLAVNEPFSFFDAVGVGESNIT